MKVDLARCAERLSALGHEARLAIVRLLLRAHPAGMVVSELQRELGIAASTLSHHLDTLHRHGLVEQRREGKFLRYTADATGLGSVLAFLVDECCSRSDLVPTDMLVGRKRTNEP
ncbi:MAG: helix-turn-helix transcriptional regulator [Deltaproteobacteria bacterium]|nr:helix-turn-helix transcriptional regulator [Deltaproteobacteria bacterium]